MTRLEVPLLYRTLWVTGDVVIRAELNVVLKDRTGVWRPAIFRVDSATEVTTMPAVTARGLGLPFPQQPTPGIRLHGQEVRPGFIRVQVPGMDGTEYIFPCYFIGDPNAPLPQPTAFPDNLLGLTGVVNQITIQFSGKATPGAPYGNMIVEKA